MKSGLKIALIVLVGGLVLGVTLIAVDEGLGGLDSRDEPSPPTKTEAEEPAIPFTLQDAQRVAGRHLVAHPSMCPKLFVGQSQAFSTGRQQQAEGRFLMRARCTDDAYLVVVNSNTREVELAVTCRVARSQFGPGACERPTVDSALFDPSIRELNWSDPDGRAAYQVRCDFKPNEFQPNQFQLFCPYTPSDIETLARARSACPPKRQWVCCAARFVSMHRAACEPNCGQGYRTLLNDVAEVCGGSDVQEGGGTLLSELWTDAGRRANDGN